MEKHCGGGGAPIDDACYRLWTQGLKVHIYLVLPTFQPGRA